MTHPLHHSTSSGNGSSQEMPQGMAETSNQATAEVVDCSNRLPDLAVEIQALQILDSSDDCIKVLDLEGRILFMNRGGQALLGIQDITPLLNTSWVNFWQESEQPAAIDAIARAAAGEVCSLQGYCPTLKGEPKWWDNKISPILGVDGSVEQLVCISRDITDRKRSEEERQQTEAALHQNQEMFSALVAAAPFGVFMIDAEFRLRQANQTALAAFNMGPLIGRDLAEALRIIWQEPFATEAINRFRHTLATGESYYSPLIVESRADIEEIQSYDWQLHRITLSDGSYGVVCYFYDLSEIKRAEAIIRRDFDRDAFLVTLNDALRPLTDAIKIQATASRVLGEYLEVSRVTYFEVRGEDYFVEQNYVNGAESLQGEGGYPIESFGANLLATYRSGRTATSTNVAIDPQFSQDQRSAYTGIQIAAYIGVPLVKQGEFVAGLAVHSSTSRKWTSDEIALAEEVAERTWAAVERARAEVNLRESEAKYRGLFESLDEGYFLADVMFDENDQPIDIFYLEANPAATRMVGQDFTGRRLREVDPSYEAYWYEIFGRVARTGMGERLEQYAEPNQKWYDFYVFKVSDENSRCVSILFKDITESKRREANAAFLTEIGEDFSRLSTADEIMQTVGAKIGAYLRVTTCNFTDVDEAHDQVTVHHGWSSPEVPSTVGTFRTSQYLSKEFERASRAGETVVICNTQTDSRTDAAGYAALNMHSFVTVPFHRNGRWTHYIAICDSRPHDWREDEIQLIEEISNRIFPRLERARAESALRVSEEKYRSLFESINQGFCLLEVLFDANDKAYDYRYLEINEAFEEQSGLTNAVGKTIRELVPNLEPQWGECYEQVVKSRESVRFEADVPSMNRVFDIYAVPSGAPGQNLVAVLFADITQRKRREANLTFLAEIQDDCARLTTADAMMQTIGAKIGAYLNLSVCAFVDIDEAHDQAIMSYAWHRADVLNLMGTYRISEFVSEEFCIAARAGTVVVVNNTNTDARTDAESCAALNVQAFVSLPFLHDGQWKFLLNVYDARPRDWREHEIELFCDLANRIFPRLERARAEAALRASEEKYRTLFDSLDEGVGSIELIFDENDRVVDYCYLEQNSSFARLTGLPSDVIGKRISEIVPNLEAFWFETFERVAKTGEPLRFEHAVAALNRWFEVYVSRVGGVGSRRVVYVYNNITDRKQAEATIATDLENTRLLRDLSARLINEDEIQVLYDEIMATAIALTKADAGTVQILDKATQDLVLLASQGFNRTMTDHFYRVNASSNTSCGIALTRGTRTLIDFDVPECDDPDGSLQMHVNAGYLSAQSTPLISRSGKAIGMVSTHWCRQHRPSDRELRFLDLLARQAADLIDRRQTEAALRESEELKQSILDSSKDCIKVLTLDGEIVYVNTGGLRLLEIDEPMLILNARWLDFWQGEDRENAKTAIAAAKAGNTGQFQGYRPTHKGTPKWWDILITPVRNSAEQVTQLLVVSRDITKQKQAETERERLLAQEQTAREQAETANRIKDEFLAVLSHELRSPLNPILGWTRLLQNKKLDAVRQREALATIERNAKLQTQLIEDLLDISRIMRGKLSLTVAPVGLPFVISAAMETVRLAAEAKNIQIILDLAPDIALVSGDTARLQQVVWNLLTNAVKFTPDAGQVTIELRQLDRSAQIRVIDTGKGISPQFLPYVFEYFRQEDGSTTRKFGGLGLGLAIVRQIVQMHGGDVRAESQGEGQGATFIVQLPTMQQRAVVSEPSQPQSDTELSLVGIQILLVDDEPDTRKFQAFLLEQSGAKVTAVASGLEALQALEQSIPDVIVSDIGMPEIDGYMLLQQIHSRLSERGGSIPAVALTAYAAEIDQQRAIQVGFQRHITKPVEPEALVKAVSTLLERT